MNFVVAGAMDAVFRPTDFFLLLELLSEPYNLLSPPRDENGDDITV